MMTEQIKIKHRTSEWNSLKVFATIQELSSCYFARIYSSGDFTKVTFYSRPNIEYVCSWKFDNYFFNTELKGLFTKHNSVTIGGERSKTK